MKDVEMYTDGACSGNPGPGGYGCVLRYIDEKGEEHLKEVSGYEVETTNNRMELIAVIEGLRQLKYPVHVTIYSDSKYVVDAFNKEWVFKWKKEGFAGRKNADLWKELIDFMYTTLSEYNISFEWVKGHASNKFNNRADELAVQAYQKYLTKKS